MVEYKYDPYGSPVLSEDTPDIAKALEGFLLQKEKMDMEWSLRNTSLNPDPEAGGLTMCGGYDDSVEIKVPLLDITAEVIEPGNYEEESIEQWRQTLLASLKLMDGAKTLNDKVEN